MPSIQIIKNARIVTPSETIEGCVLLSDGIISDVHEGCLSSTDAIDFEGDYLLPGLVDVHTDNLERLIMPRSNALWPVMAAFVSHDAQLATAGVTTVLDSLCIGTAGSGVRAFSVVEETIAAMDAGKKAEMFRSNHLLHLRAEISNPEMESMFQRVYDHPDVRLVSLMDHTPGQRQWADLEKFMAMEKKQFGMTQEEMTSMLQKAQDNHKLHSGPNRKALLSILSDRPVVIASHDDTTLEHVEEAHAEGIHVSEFPTTRLAAEAAHAKQMRIVAGSPNVVLGRSHSGNVSVVELAELGLLDALSSDYAPSSLLYSAFILARGLNMPLHDAVKLVTLNPAELVGLEDRGSVEAGKRADLIRVKIVGGIPLVRMVWTGGARVA